MQRRQTRRCMQRRSSFPVVAGCQGSGGNTVWRGEGKAGGDSAQEGGRACFAGWRECERLLGRDAGRGGSVCGVHGLRQSACPACMCVPSNKALGSDSRVHHRLHALGSSVLAEHVGLLALHSCSRASSASLIWLSAGYIMDHSPLSPNTTNTTHARWASRCSSCTGVGWMLIRSTDSRGPCDSSVLKLLRVRQQQALPLPPSPFTNPALLAACGLCA